MLICIHFYPISFSDEEPINRMSGQDGVFEIKEFEEKLSQSAAVYNSSAQLGK